MKIGLTGTMSCGKTTLVKSLSQLPEFQNYKCFTEKSKELMQIGIPLNTDSTINGQTVFLSHRAQELMDSNMITDRTVIDVMAFTYAAKSIVWPEKEAFEQYAKHLISQYDYIFYVSPEGVEIEDNGIRTIDSEYRNLIDFTIKHFILNYKHRIKNYHELKGTNEERISTIKQVLDL